MITSVVGFNRNYNLKLPIINYNDLIGFNEKMLGLVSREIRKKIEDNLGIKEREKTINNLWKDETIEYSYLKQLFNKKEPEFFNFVILKKLVDTFLYKIEASEVYKYVSYLSFLKENHNLTYKDRIKRFFLNKINLRDDIVEFMVKFALFDLLYVENKRLESIVDLFRDRTIVDKCE